MGTDSWFRNIWKTFHKHETVTEKPVIGVLAFEVANLMSKLIHVWQSLADKQVKKLRETICGSIGIKNLVSNDEDYIVQLMSAEMIDNLANVAEAVARLGTKCIDANLNYLENAFTELFKLGVDRYGFELGSRNMERTVKKMQKLVSINANLCREWETLDELEQNVRRMSTCDELDSKTVFEYQKKVVWKQHEVQRLQQKSLWNKTYGDMVMLMTRSIFTIFKRIKHVFGFGHHEGNVERKDSLQSPSIHSSAIGILRFSSGPLVKKRDVFSGPLFDANENYQSYSGPIGSTSTKSSSLHRRNKALESYSGPLFKTPLANSRNVSKRAIFGLKMWYNRNNASNIERKFSIPDTGQLGTSNQFEKELLNSKKKLLEPKPETLGATGLALHYANVIILIEKLVATPHLIGQDDRDELYNMLPSSLRASIRARLMPFNKANDSSLNDINIARKWNESMTRILEWLSPLAHDTLKWQSERSYEQRNLPNRGMILQVQTLNFVNQEKAESIITELLVGLNYVWRFGREINADAFLKCSNTTKLGDYFQESSSD